MESPSFFFQDKKGNIHFFGAIGLNVFSIYILSKCLCSLRCAVLFCLSQKIFGVTVTEIALGVTADINNAFILLKWCSTLMPWHGKKTERTHNSGNTDS